MKKLIYILLLFLSLTAQPQNFIVDCGLTNRIERNTVIEIDTLDFRCAKYLLVQDNAVLYIKTVIGNGIIQRSDAGGGIHVEALNIDRRPGDANPTIVFWKRPEDYEVTLSTNLDVTYQNQE